MSPLFWITLLLILGILLFLAELVLLPGITIAAIGSLAALSAAVAWSFAAYGISCGFMTLGIVGIIIIIMLIFFFRRSTWRKVSLATELPDTIERPISELCKIGASGISISRLAPMGKVIIDGRVFEAKTMGGFVDEGAKIKVIGFENQNIIVEINN